MSGSPRRGIIRTSLPVAIIAGPAQAAEPRSSRLVRHFLGTHPPESFRPPEPTESLSRAYRNPILLAQEWRRALTDLGCSSRAELARALGVSRARVTQVLRLLELTPEVVEALAALGDPLPRPIVTERGLRSLLNLPAEEQKHVLQVIADKADEVTLK